jgi:hypothetical protein
MPLARALIRPSHFFTNSTATKILSASETTQGKLAAATGIKSAIIYPDLICLIYISASSFSKFSWSRSDAWYSEANEVNDFTNEDNATGSELLIVNVSTTGVLSI